MKNKVMASLCLLAVSCYMTGCAKNEVETITTETIKTQSTQTNSKTIMATEEEVVDNSEIEKETEIVIETTEESETMPEENIETTEDILPEENVENDNVENSEEETTLETEQEPVVEQPEEVKPEVVFEVTKKDGVLYAKSSVNVRTLPSKQGEIISTLSQNNEVTQTGVCDNGWVEILYNNQTAYVSGNYLSTEKYVPPTYTWDDSIVNADNASDYTLSQVSKYFLMVPENIRTKFKENGWVIKVTTGNLGEMIYGEKKSIKAVIVYPQKVIWVDSRKGSATAIIHEMGHFMDDQLFFTSMGKLCNDAWEAEVETFKANHKTHDNNTNNPTEYFAEFFEVMILNPSIRQKCPMTAAFMDSCIAEMSTF